MGFFKRAKKENDNEPIVAAVIQNPTSSLIFQDILKENEIPFICRQQGAGGYTKHILGSGFAADMIYVSSANVDRAKELYEAYLGEQAEFEVEFKTHEDE